MKNEKVVDAPASQVTYKSNEKIDPLVASIQQLWQKGETNRLKLGEFFSKLRKETKQYKRDEETGLSYASAVRRTGVPRSTAELYRGMWELSSEHKIPAQVFLSLCEAGFNLATDLDEQATVPGIVSDHRELLTGKIADYDALAEALIKEYGKQSQTTPGAVEEVAAMQKEIADLQKHMTGTMPDSLRKAGETAIAKKQAELHALRVTALAGLAKAVAPFVGQNKTWAENYAKKLKDNQVLTAQRYTEAVKFAKSLAAEMAGGE